MKLHPLTAPLEAIRVGFLAGSAVFFLVGAGSAVVPFVEVEFVFTLFPVGVVLGAGYAIARYVLFEYELTGETFDISSGVLARKHREIPVHRVQNLDIDRGLLQRLVGLAVVSVETAGGGESEAQLRFVDYETARHLQSEVRDRKRRETTDEQPTDAAGSDAATEPTRWRDAETEPLFALSASRLALLGVSSIDLNSSAVLVFLAGVIVPMVIDAGVLAILALVTSPSNLAIGLVATAAINAAVVVARHYGFTLVRVGDELRYEHGLLTRRSGSIPLDKIQRVAIHENLLMRRLGFASLTVETAGYAPGQSRAIGSQTAVPIARREEVIAIMRAIEGFDAEAGERAADDSFVRPPKRARRRYAARYTIATLFVTGALYVGVEVLSLVALSLWYAPLALLILVPIAAHLKWSHRGYRIDDDHVLTRNGFWRRSIRVVPYYRLQTVIQRTTIVQRRWRLATVVIDTAGSFTTRFSPAHAVDIDARAATELRETACDRLHGRVGTRSTPVPAADGGAIDDR